MTIDLGKWTKTAASSSANTTNFQSQKTYIVTSPISNGADVSKIDVQLVWIDGIKSKPIKIPRNIIDRFKSMEIV